MPRRAFEREGGQTTLEFFMTFGVVMFLFAAIIHLSLICSTKLITNYSAWIAARVWAVNEDDASDKARDAAKEVLESLNWGVNDTNVEVNIEGENEGVRVRYQTPLGIPFVLTNNTAGRITCVGWGAVPDDSKFIAESGDNKEPE